MNQANETFNLFADDDQAARRVEAVDQLHFATAIYTDQTTVNDLLGRLNWPNGQARMVDPSCGDGMFLGCALTKALNARTIADDDLAYLLEGWEIHPHACEQARARVKAILMTFGRSPERAAKIAVKMVHNRDFITDGPTTPTWDFIAGNPPYLRWVNIPQLLKDEYASIVPDYANADLLHSFLDRCASTLREGGSIGFVTSDRWLSNMGASKLRERLGKDLMISHLERLDVTSCFYHPKNRKAGSPPRIHPVAVVMAPSGDIPITKEAIYPEVDQSKYTGYPTLGEIATVRLAPYFGNGGVFVLDERDVDASGIPMEHLVPAIDTDDIIRESVDGKTVSRIGTPKRYAIRTNPNQEPCAEIMDYLRRNIERMEERNVKGKLWVPRESFHNQDLSQPCLLVPRIATSPVSVPVPANILPLNHNLSIVTGDEETLKRVERALQTDLAREWVADHAARLENGYFSLTTTLLRKLPISV